MNCIMSGTSHILHVVTLGRGPRNERALIWLLVHILLLNRGETNLLFCLIS